LERKIEIIREREERGDTYMSIDAILEKYGVVDLHISRSLSKNSSALEVACPPPGIGAKF
jgi:hypothetical protein